MPKPTTPIMASPVITTYTQSPSYTCEKVSGSNYEYRIEERRRTIYVKSSDPHMRLSEQHLDELIKLTATPEGAQSGGHRRSKSLEEQDLHSGEISGEQNSPRDGDKRGQRRAHRSGPTLTVTPVSPARSSPMTPASFSRRSWASIKPSQILFYHKHDPYYGFTNFSPHHVMYKGKRYPTSEHLFQSFKFLEHRPLLAEHIRTCSEFPSKAFSEARRFQPEVRGDWTDVNIEKMDEVLWHKFTQHKDLQKELLSTGDAGLVEDSDKDAFWGVGADGSGRNELGKALERLRARLRKQ